MRNLIITLFFISLPLGLLAQSFSWEVAIEEVDSSGFHKIILPPDVVSKLSTSFYDIRLYDDQNMEVPFLFKTAKNIYPNQQLFNYKIIENKHHKRHSFTKIVFENTANTDVTNLVIKTIGRDMKKHFRISGSDNKKDWYIIKDNFISLPGENLSDTVTTTLFDFAKTAYKFYELIVYDVDNKAVPVLNIATSLNAFIDIKYSDIRTPNIVQNDTLQDGKSIIDINFDQAYYIDKLILNIKGSHFYRRKAILKPIDTLYEQKFKISHFNSLNKQTVVHSEADNNIYLNNYKAHKLQLIIENGDDTPLFIQSIEAKQLYRYLIAELKKGYKYTIKLGDKKIHAPLYDLRFFEDSIPKILPELNVLNIKKIEQKNTNKKTKYKIDIIYLWSIAILLVILLLAFAIKMFFNINNRNIK